MKARQYENHSRSRSRNLRFHRAQNQNFFHREGLRRIQRWLGIPRQAVVREIREELDATVKVGDLIDTIEYDYPAFHLSMDCFWCEVASGELKLLEAEAARWLTKEELDSVQWLPADVTLIDKIRKCME